MKNSKMFTYICLVLVAIPIAASEPQTKEIGRLSQAYKTFKNDMRCLLSRTKKCTPEQRKRIRNNAFRLVGVLVAATGVWAGVWWFRSWREQTKEGSDDEDIIFSDDDESDEELSPPRGRQKGEPVTTFATEVRTKELTEKDLAEKTQPPAKEWPEKELTEKEKEDEAFNELFEIAGSKEPDITRAKGLIDLYPRIIKSETPKTEETVLFEATRAGNEELVGLFLDNKADPEALNWSNVTPIDIARIKILGARTEDNKGMFDKFKRIQSALREAKKKLLR